MITFYQRYLAPLWRVISPFQCRYTPTCSEYGKLAIKRGGLVKGTLKTAWRILRCNPWSRGGIDLP